MLELLRTIALLCQVHNGIDWYSGYKRIQKEQLKCQQEYYNCTADYILSGKTERHEIALAVCLKKRKVK